MNYRWNLNLIESFPYHRLNLNRGDLVRPLSIQSFGNTIKNEQNENNTLFLTMLSNVKIGLLSGYTCRLTSLLG